MIWNDKAIAEWASQGGVTPFDAKLVNGASIDLRLSNQVAYLSEVYDSPVVRYGDKLPMSKMWKAPVEFERLLLRPGQVVLLSTMETVSIPSNVSAQLLSKSTAGRCLIEHFHSGYVDPQFNGTLTLEIINHSNIVWDLRPGDRIVQLVMMDMVDSALVGYSITGRYQNQVLPKAPEGW